MSALAPGFADPERAAQRAFRQLLEAWSQPGRIVALSGVAAPPPGIGPAAAAILLTLADADTAVWTDAGDAAAAWLRFHAGCPVVADRAIASFVHAATAPPLAELDGGSAEAPQRAATLILEVAGLRAGEGWRLRGPGIESERSLAVDGLAAEFVAELRANHARYPVGVDVILCAGDRIAALPRSIRVEAG